MIPFPSDSLPIRFPPVMPYLIGHLMTKLLVPVHRRPAARSAGSMGNAPLACRPPVDLVSWFALSTNPYYSIIYKNYVLPFDSTQFA